MLPERLGCRAGETDKGGLEAFRARVGRSQPEDGVRAVECLVDHGRVAVEPSITSTCCRVSAGIPTGRGRHRRPEPMLGWFAKHMQ